MKFIIDAHLPKKLAELLRYRGYDALHTLELPNKNHTKDSEINNISINEQRVVITKDVDFVDSLLISNRPYKLLYLTTGNITNKILLELFSKNIEKIVDAIQKAKLVEMSLQNITIKL